MKNLKLLLLLTPALVFLAACGGSQDALTPDSPENSMLTNVKAEYLEDENTLTITLDFEKQSGWASNQFAVWLEDPSGNYVHTLHVTDWAAGGGAEKRDEVLVEWVNRSGFTRWAQKEIDAVSSATPNTGSLSYSYTLDSEGYPYGELHFFVEGNLRWSNRVLFSGVIETRGGSATADAQAEYIYQ
jgi:hypothetical protein